MAKLEDAITVIDIPSRHQNDCGEDVEDICHQFSFPEYLTRKIKTEADVLENNDYSSNNELL